MIGFLGHFCFLKHFCLLFALGASYGSKGKNGLSGLSVPAFTQS